MTSPLPLIYSVSLKVIWNLTKFLSLLDNKKLKEKRKKQQHIIVKESDNEIIHTKKQWDQVHL